MYIYVHIYAYIQIATVLQYPISFLFLKIEYLDIRHTYNPLGIDYIYIWDWETSHMYMYICTYTHMHIYYNKGVRSGCHSSNPLIWSLRMSIHIYNVSFSRWLLSLSLSLQALRYHVLTVETFNVLWKRELNLKMSQVPGKLMPAVRI